MLEKLGVVINGRVQLLIAVVERQLGVSRSLKIEAAFQLLQTHAGKVKWPIVSVLDQHFDRCMSDSGKIYGISLGVDLTTAAHHVHAFDIARAYPVVFIISKFDIAAKVRVWRWSNAKLQTLGWNLVRDFETENRFFA